MRMIDADALMERLKEWDTNDATDKALYNFALNRVLEAPTVEPERKMGRWIYSKQGYTCSECKTQFPTEVHYLNPEYTLPKHCPECGARLEGGE
jgi:DNA-directed RNA polymerase subunit RPC12/RpoP